MPLYIGSNKTTVGSSEIMKSQKKKHDNTLKINNYLSRNIRTVLCAIGTQSAKVNFPKDALPMFKCAS